MNIYRNSRYLHFVLSRRKIVSKNSKEMIFDFSFSMSFIPTFNQTINNCKSIPFSFDFIRNIQMSQKCLAIGFVLGVFPFQTTSRQSRRQWQRFWFRKKYDKYMEIDYCSVDYMRDSICFTASCYFIINFVHISVGLCRLTSWHFIYCMRIDFAAAAATAANVTNTTVRCVHVPGVPLALTHNKCT